VKEFEAEFIAMLVAQHKPVLAALKAGKLDDEFTSVLKSVAKDVAKNYS
jgi:F-type H+-transporting ATPase subunit alpha